MGLGNTVGPPGGPPGPPGVPRGPERVSEESNDMYKQDLLYNLFVALKKAFFCLLSNLIHFFNIFSRGLNKGGGGQLPPQFYISVSSPAMLAGSPLNIFATPFPL